MNNNSIKDKTVGASPYGGKPRLWCGRCSLKDQPYVGGDLVEGRVLVVDECPRLAVSKAKGVGGDPVM